MKFDILEFTQNYDLFYSITGDFYEAVGMYLSTVAFIFLFAFLINGITVGRLPAFKGKKALMGTTLTILMTIIGETFYSFLEYFKTPLAWINQHFWLLVGCFFGGIILFIIITFMVLIIKEKIKNETNNTTNGNV